MAHTDTTTLLRADLQGTARPHRESKTCSRRARLAGCNGHTSPRCGCLVRETESWGELPDRTRLERGAGLGERRAGPAVTLQWGTACGQRVKISGKGRRASTETAQDKRRRRWVPRQRRHLVRPGSPQGGQAPGTPRNLAPLRPRRERTRRGRGSYPPQCGDGVSARGPRVGTPSPHWGEGRPGRQDSRELSEPDGGKQLSRA